MKIDKANFLNEKQMEIAVANLSPKIIKVWVTGEVNEPGEKLIKVSDTLVCIPCWRIRVYTRLKHGIG